MLCLRNNSNSYYIVRKKSFILINSEIGAWFMECFNRLCTMIGGKFNGINRN
jgi:hypothetical protein